MSVQLSAFGQTSPKGSLLILHGLFGSKQNWASIVKSLNAKGIPTAALDLRNHGSSGWSHEMNISNMTLDVIRFMDKEGVGEAHILGHSLGGKIGMNAALEFPDRVQSLISVDMSLKGKDNSQEFMFYIDQMKKVSGVTDKKIARGILNKTIDNTNIVSFLLTNLVQTPSGYDFRINLDALEKRLPDLLKAKISNSSSDKYTRDVLFIGGANADYINPSHHDLILSVFPKARFEYLDTGHWVHYEKPHEFMSLVLDFVGS